MKFIYELLVHTISYFAVIVIGVHYNLFIYITKRYSLLPLRVEESKREFLLI